MNGQPYATNSFTYEPISNLLLSSTDALGHTTSFGYNAFGQVLYTIDARGMGTTNTYDSSGNLLTAKDALGNTTVNVYNGGGLLVGSTDAVGTITTNVFDAAQNLIATALLSPAGIILSSNSYAYDLNGNQTNSVSWRQLNGSWIGATNICIYDALNRVVQTIAADGGSNTIAYNAVGKQQSTVDQLGRTTRYTYDALGRASQVNYPDGLSSYSNYDAVGNRISSVDRAGHATTYYYDALNRLTQTVWPDGTTNTTVYDDLGRVKFSVDGRGITNAFSYDSAGHQRAITNGWGTSIAAANFFGYDANGNQVYFTNSLGNVTTNVFDTLNRQWLTQFPDGTSIGTGFDFVGRRIAQTNQEGIVTWFGYDGAGRLLYVTNALGKAEQMITRYEYDEAGNEIAQIDALLRTNRFGYDNLGRRTSHAMPDPAQTERFSYDLPGNLLRHTNFNGLVITNKYDALNRLTNRCSVFGYKVDFAYSANGQRTNMVDPSGATAYFFDERDRLVAKTNRPNDGPVMSVNYRYDRNGNVTNLWSGSASGVTNFYRYDALNRLTNVLGRDGVSAGYTFDPVGNLQSTSLGAGITNLCQYDKLNRLTNMVWKTSSATPTTIGAFFYQLNLAGIRTNLIETLNGSRSYAWKYDALYRMTNENISTAGVLGYRFDPVGNRTNRSSTIADLVAQTFSYTTNDWLVGDTYDPNGNTTVSSGGSTYQYDALNHLTNVNNRTVLMTYDGDGNRISKKVGGVTTYYLVDDRNPTGYSQVVEEYQGSTLSVVYTHGLNLVSQRRSGTVSYYVQDGHGNVRALTGTGGTVTDTYQFDAYGTKLSASTGTTVNNYLYCGEQYDSDIGFYYLRARYYQPGTGRFWTMDTHEGSRADPLSLHKYLYCSGNPVNNFDPSGHETLPTLLTTFGIKAIMFRAVIGSAVGVWDANFRGYSQWQGLAWGAVGGAVGPLIPWQIGVTLTAYGIGEALEDGDYDAALFRGAVAVVGAGTWRWSNKVPGGRLGNANTQLQNSRISAYLVRKGWTIRGGGGSGIPEERIAPPGGGRKGEVWVDITAEKNVGGTVRTLRIQTVDTLASGAPTPRELSASSRIRAYRPGDKLLLVPKAEQGKSPLPLFNSGDDEEGP